MTTVVNLFGGPGVGKSTAATGAFSLLKQQGHSIEYVSEYAKDLTWEGLSPLLNNQIHVFAEQYRRQVRLLDKVDYIITDSPILLSCIYIGYRPESLPEAYVEMAKQFFYQSFKLFNNVNFIVKREKPYVEKGRNQNLEKAKSIDADVIEYLSGKGVEWHQTSSFKAIDDIVAWVNAQPVET